MKKPLAALIVSIFALGSVSRGQNVPAAQASLPTGTAHYMIQQNGKKLGETDFAVSAIATGYQVVSHGKMSLNKFSYAFSNTQRLDPQLNLVTSSLSGVVNGQAVNFETRSDPAGKRFSIEISAGGKRYQSDIDRNLNTVMLTDLDSGGYMLLAQLARFVPQDAWAFLPKQNGVLVPLKFEPDKDASARYNGSAFTARHDTVTLGLQNAIQLELYFSQDGQALEIYLPQQNFEVIRDGFELKERPKRKPLPRGPASNPATVPQQRPAAPPSR